MSAGVFIDRDLGRLLLKSEVAKPGPSSRTMDTRRKPNHSKPTVLGWFAREELMFSASAIQRVSCIDSRITREVRI